MEHRPDTASDPRRTVVFSTIAKALPIIIGVTAIFGALGILLSDYQQVQYTAESRMVLSTTRSFEPLGDGGAGSPTRFVANQRSVMQSRPVLEIAVEELNTDAIADGTETVEALRGALEVSAPADTDQLEIVTTGSTGEQAAARANAVGTAYATYVTQQVAEAAAAATAASVADPARVAEIAYQTSVYGDGVQTFEEATVPTSPSSPQPLRNGFLLAVLGALITTGLVVWRRGQPLADRGVLVESAGAPVLGVVPVPLPRLRKRKAPPLPLAQDFSMTLVALGYVVADTSGVVMCSGIRRESGAATVALGLAAAAAEQQRRVVVVDADTRGADLVRHSGQRSPALPVAALSDPSVALERVATEVVGLRPAGGGSVHLAAVSVDGQSMWGADALRQGLRRLVDSFDIVVLHAGPVATDPMAFALLRESSVLVAAVDERARTADLLALRDKLDLAGAQCDGLVLTRPVPTRRRRRAAPVAAPLLPEVSEAPASAPAGPQMADGARAPERVVYPVP